jgi:two-component system sensor histidine kinase RegB
MIAAAPTATPAASPTPAVTLDSEPLIGVAWLWRLRWTVLGAQLLMLVVAGPALGMPLDGLAIAVTLLVSVASNLWLGHRLQRRAVSHRSIFIGLLFDVLVLTGALHCSGGAANPFSALYVVHVAVAALLLGTAGTLTLTVITSLCFAGLLLASELHSGHAAHGSFSMHLRGMAVAYALSASFVAYFVTKIARALRQREAQMLALRRYASGMERVASLATMAAGAAHELGSPLSSIAVAATELAGALSAEQRWAPFAEEARHIREEVARCRTILVRLGGGAGQPAGEVPERIMPSAIVERLRREFAPADAAILQVGPVETQGLPIWAPPTALVQSLGNLVRNAIDAARAGGSAPHVELRISAEEGRASFEVLDNGPGIPPEIAARLGEPFLSTKPHGKGMGLGLFLVKTFLDQVGGALCVEGLASGGTRARLRLGEGSIEARWPA